MKINKYFILLICILSIHFVGLCQDITTQTEEIITTTTTTLTTSTITLTTPTLEKVVEPTSAESQIRDVVCSINGKGTYYSNWAYISEPDKEITLSVLAQEGGGENWASINKKYGSDKENSHIRVASSVETKWKVDECNILYSDDTSIKFKTPAKSGMYKIELNGKEISSITKLDDPSAKPVEEESSFGFKLNLLVSYKFDRNGSGAIEGYPIGIYPNEEKPDNNSFVSDHVDIYRPPMWFVKVTPDNKNLHISKHFVLGDFYKKLDQKEESGFISIDPKLIDQLELMTTALDEKGINSGGLIILRAYMTPMEIMKLQRDGVSISDFTRYIYGDGAALIIDNNKDGKMDDLNADGQIDMSDANFLGDIAAEVQKKSKHYGGIGTYSKPSDEYLPDSPYVQIDLRGSYARW